MSKSTLYRHFSSKEDVVITLLDDRLHELERGLESSLADSDDSRQALRLLVELCAHHAERLPRAALADADCMPSECRELVSRSREAMAKAFRQVLQRGHSQGQLDTPHPALTAEALSASSWAAMVAAARGDIDTERGAAVRAVLPMFRI